MSYGIKSFTVLKNTTAIDILLLTLRVTWSLASYVALSYCDLHGIQIDLQ
jgi:hypothetical protein